MLERDWRAIQRLDPVMPDLVDVGLCRSDPGLRLLLVHEPARSGYWGSTLPVLSGNEGEDMEVVGLEELREYEVEAASWLYEEEVTEEQVADLKRRKGWEGATGRYITVSPSQSSLPCSRSRSPAPLDVAGTSKDRLRPRPASPLRVDPPSLPRPRSSESQSRGGEGTRRAGGVGGRVGGYLCRDEGVG